MSAVTLEQMIASHPFFNGIEPTLLQLIAAGAKLRELPAGEMIFHQGEPVDRFYLLRTGRVALDIHTPRRGGHTIETIEDGEILGWSWLIPPFRWRFDARVVEPVTAIEIDGRQLREACELDHDLGYELYRRFATLIGQRLEATRIQLMDLYGMNH